jgi:hypothetical protein
MAGSSSKVPTDSTEDNVENSVGGIKKSVV